MPADPLPPLAPDIAPAITLRSILIGLAGVCFICGVAPYNDFALENTFLIGNFLPLGLVLILMALVLGVNVPLRRWRPRLALRQTELAVITLMVLAACSVPSSGLMRYLPGSFVGTYYGAAERPTDWGPAVDAANIPEWLLPKIDGGSAAEKGYQDIIRYYHDRDPNGVVPWAAWIRPAVTWGVMIAMLWGLLICLSLIVRKQWTENERLSFPLATIYESLIEAPAPGHALNALFRSPGFWWAAGFVFALRSMNALSSYNADVPYVPLYYDFRDIFVDPPWSYTDICFKTASIYFSMIGIAYLIQSTTAFSLWFFYILWQVAAIILSTAEIPLSDNMRRDQTFGGVVMFSLILIYVGRHHWWMVIRHMFAKRRPGENHGRYLSYALAGWGAAICFFGVIVWLMLAGMSLAAAVIITTITVMFFMVVARVLADTGLMFIQINYPMNRVFYYPAIIPATPHYPVSQTSFFFASWFTELFHDVRENLAAFFTLGIRVTDDSIEPAKRPRRVGYGLLAAVVLALSVGYIVSWASMLKVEYTFAQTTSSSALLPNVYGVENAVRANMLEPAAAYQEHNLPQDSKTPLGGAGLNLGVGAAIVGACSVLRLMYAWWPLNPVGFVVMYSFAMQKVWFSLMVGWILKVAIVRLGGAKLLKQARPVFIGLILGEAFTAAFWLVVSLAMHLSGHEYKSMLFLPG